MAIIKTANMFNMAEKYMLNEVKRRVEDKLVKELLYEAEKNIRTSVREATKDYIITGIDKITDMLKMQEEFVIYIQENDQEPVKISPEN